jgi:hypothetical protein
MTFFAGAAEAIGQIVITAIVQSSKGFQMLSATKVNMGAGF